MFVDNTKLKLIAGKGGNGAVAWRREKYIPKGGPTGGNGGKGGSIILKSDSSLFSLDCYRNRRQIKADSGAQGGPNRRQGKSGSDLIITVPIGTIVRQDGHTLFDFTKDGETFEVCKGGKGGLGNDFFKTPTNRAPNRSTPGKAGEERTVELELKLLADVGFVGMPNAGKSTLLSGISKARFKTGAYPFTTLAPNLSYIQYEDYTRLYLADIPGIIKGASNNRGLGLSFLKHVERCRALVFILDASFVEERDPLADLKVLQDELRAHSPDLLDKPFLIALNKTDALDDPSRLKKMREALPHALEISGLTGEGLPHLISSLKEIATLPTEALATI